MESSNSVNDHVIHLFNPFNSPNEVANSDKQIVNAYSFVCIDVAICVFAEQVGCDAQHVIYIFFSGISCSGFSYFLGTVF